MTTDERTPTSVIEPPSGWAIPNFKDVWQYRDLLGLLIWRDISARYRQSVVGIGWAIIRPALTTLIFTVIFGNLAEMPSGKAPYMLFSFCAIMPWSYFASALNGSTASLVGSTNLLTKVYFPRVILPISAIVIGLVDLAVQFAMLIPLMLYFGVTFSWTLITLPFFILLAMISAFTAGIWLTVLNVKYRDVGHAIPFVVSMWMYSSSVVIPSSLVRDGYSQFWPYYAMNPMVGVIDGFRWAIYGEIAPDWIMMGCSMCAVAVVLFFGLLYFRKMETTFADII